MPDLTRALEAVDAGVPQAGDQLMPLVYGELRALAAAKLRSQPPGMTLQATALVHEAWLKLARSPGPGWRGRQHFFRAAAEAMRQILVDRARRRTRQRHGAQAPHVELDALEIAAPARAEVLVKLDEALHELHAASPERADIVTLRFFGGLSEPEIAELLELSERTVQRHWRYARAWLFDRIGTDAGL